MDPNAQPDPSFVQALLHLAQQVRAVPNGGVPSTPLPTPQGAGLTAGVNPGTFFKAVTDDAGNVMGFPRQWPLPDQGALLRNLLNAGSSGDGALQTSQIPEQLKLGKGIVDQAGGVSDVNGLLPFSPDGQDVTAPFQAAYSRGLGSFPAVLQEMARNLALGTNTLGPGVLPQASVVDFLKQYMPDFAMQMGAPAPSDRQV